MLNRSVLVFGVLALAAFAPKTARADFPELSPEQRKILGWDFSDLKTNHIRSVEAFLASKFFSAQERRDFRLVRKSVSLQRASSTLPRVICYGPRKLSILSFNGGLPGELDQPGTQNKTLDLMIWNEEDEAYDFFHISFQKRMRVLGPQPEICMECHTKRLAMLRDKDPDQMVDEELENFKKRVATGKIRPLNALKRYRSLIY